jgi:hypothetical protein
MPRRPRSPPTPPGPERRPPSHAQEGGRGSAAGRHRAGARPGCPTGPGAACRALTPGKPRHQTAAATPPPSPGRQATTSTSMARGRRRRPTGPGSGRIDSCPQSAGDGTQITAGLPLELGRWRDPEQPQPPPRLPGDRAAVLPEAVHPHRPAALLDPAGDGLEHHLRGLGLGDQGGHRPKAPARRPLCLVSQQRRGVLEALSWIGGS